MKNWLPDKTKSIYNLIANNINKWKTKKEKKIKNKINAMDIKHAIRY